MSLKKRKCMNSNNKRIIILICLVSIFLQYPFIGSAFSASQQSDDVSLLKYEVNGIFVGSLTQTIQLISNETSTIVDCELFVPLVRNETARHYVVLNISSSIGQPAILNDSSGNKYAYWSHVTIARNQVFSVELNYYVLSFSTHYIIDSSLITDYNRSSELYVKYTQPEELIQSNNAEIVSKAQSLIGNESNIHEKVSKIYNFVITHMRYAAQEEERGALWALEKGVGDCSEYSYLFVALCRAAGIPARVQAGFAFHSINETLEDGHMWAEYYLENYGWIPVDATWRLFDAMDYRHFSSIQSTPEIIPYTNYFFNSTSDLELQDEQNLLLQQCPPTVLGAESFIENASKTIQKIMQAKSALFLAQIFGATLIFPSEASKAKQTLLESQINLQNAVDSWEALPHLAQSNVTEALQSAEEALQGVWMLIAELFTLFIGVLAVVMLVVFVLMKRHQRR
jgi:hypothetical protein